MRRFHYAALVAVAVVGFATVASAADMPVKGPVYQAPAAPAVYNWTGFYVGGTVGLATTQTTVSHFDTGNGCWWTCALIQNLKDSGQGFIGGLQAGYNYQMGAVVLGLETDISATNIGGSYNQFCNGSGYCDYTQRNKLRALGTLRGRIGYAFDRALLYGTGGLAYGLVSHHVNDNDDPGLWDSSVWHLGYTLGGGLEYALTNSWTVKLEGLYYNLGTKDLTFTCPASFCGTTQNYPAHFRTDGAVARLGGNYKF